MKIYRGIVRSNNDPRRQGRVQVFIKELHSQAASTALPWAEVIGGTAFGLVGNTGVSSVLHNGTNVYVVFENDDTNKTPIVLGTVQGTINSDKFPDIKDPNGVHPQGDQGDPNIHPALKSYDEYNSTNIITTESGHMIRISDVSGSQEIDVIHCSGSFIKFTNDGSIKIYAKKNLEIDVEKDLIYTVLENLKGEVRKNFTEKVLQNRSRSVKGNEDIQIEGTFSSKITGNATIDTQGTLLLKSAGDTLNQCANHIVKASFMDVKCGGEFKADVTISGKSFLGHTHTGVHGTTTPPN
jgi:hypothetical protein